jgi:phycocyanobilin lyase alpha subunit
MSSQKAEASRAIARIYGLQLEKDVDALLSELSSPLGRGRISRRPVRAYAAHALGKLEDRRAVPYLVAAAGDSSADVRSAVVGALSAIADPSAGSTFVTALRDPSRLVRSHAVKGLARINARDAIDSLREAAAHDEDAWVRLFAAEALSELGDKEMSRLVTAQLNRLRWWQRQERKRLQALLRDAD